MHIFVVHNSAYTVADTGDYLLRLAYSCGPLTELIQKRISENCCSSAEDIAFELPEDWKQTGAGLNLKQGVVAGKSTKLIISNGRFLTSVDLRLLNEAVAKAGCDVVAVDIKSNLRQGSERVLTGPQQDLFGFRLLYGDTVVQAPVPDDWPHHLFVSSDKLARLFSDGMLHASFSEFLERCSDDSAAVTGLHIGGTVLDLNTEEGLLSLLAGGLKTKGSRDYKESNGFDMPADSRVFGEVASDNDVKIGNNVIIAGPAVIGEGVNVEDSAVIRESIIGRGVTVPSGCIIQNRVITDSCQLTLKSAENRKAKLNPAAKADSLRSQYRIWPVFSYARFIKRIADIIAALAVLILFAPFLIIIAIVVKISSKGAAFFGDVRQGLHGKSFVCLKFRTMQEYADKLQEKLRGLNEADGPEFLIADDPRLSSVRRFLRETYIDEIPQFWNVLLGRMSVVGPRPSPESENVLCPFWRDARLSVRPGLTGLWQVCRTRQRGRDFQEWIHYDIEYVRNLSMGFDLWICWRTAVKMVKNFISQF